MRKNVIYSGLMKVLFNSGFCGSGKTNWIISKTSNVGKYIIAVDRREVIPERIKAIEAKLSMAQRLRLRLEAVHSDENQFVDALEQKKSVSSKILGKMSEFENAHHAIIFITHQAMKMCDFQSIDPSDWTIIIDEVPSNAETGHHSTPNSISFLAANYSITPTMQYPSLCQIRLADTHISAADLKNDDAHADFLNLHNNLLAKRTVLTDLSSWSVIDKVKRRWAWIAMWEMENLTDFKEIYLLGNSFEDTIAHHLISTHMSHRIKLEPFSIAQTRTWLKRDVTIEYFADDHVAGSYFFKNTPAGRNVLTNVGNYLAAAKGEDHVWSGNVTTISKLRKCGVPGLALSPKQAGTNAYQGYHNASFIYSSKQHPAEQKIHDALGVSSELVWRDRELEAGIQFFMRTSLRDPNSQDGVTLTTYDGKVASQLKSHLDQNYGFNCHLIKVGEAGKFRRIKGAAKRPSTTNEVQLSEKEKAAASSRKYRNKVIASKKALGTYRPRGRPAKQ